MSAPRLLVVGGGFFQLGLIRAARRIGAEVAVVDRDPAAPGMALADHPVAVDTSDAAAVVAVAERLGVGGVVTAASDAAVAAVAAVAEARGLAGLRPEVARRCRDKLATFERLRAAGLGVPETRRAADLAEARAAVAELGGLPVVVKPRSAAGGRGVTIVEREDALGPALERALVYAKPGEGALVQERVGGRSVGAEVFFWRGAMVGAFLLDDQYQAGFVSPVGHSYPPDLDPHTAAALLSDVGAAGTALGLSDGPANFDLRRTDGRTVVIEVNARLGGNSISELVALATGVDLPEAAARAALGEDPAAVLRPRRLGAAATRLLVARGRGVLRVGANLDAVRGRPGVAAIDLLAKDGAEPPLRVDDWVLLGRVAVVAQTGPAAAAFADEVASEVGRDLRLEP